MTKFTYKRKMMWANFWVFMLGIYQWFYMPDKCSGLYGWIISQCGFVYAGDYESMKGN